MILYHNIKITFALHHRDSLKNTLLKTKLFLIKNIIMECTCTTP